MHYYVLKNGLLDIHYFKINNEIMQYSIVGNDIALIMHYRALLKRSGTHS